MKGDLTIGGKPMGKVDFTLRIDTEKCKAASLRAEFFTREIPKHRFVEYEPSDLEWLIPLGMAPRKQWPPTIASCGFKLSREATARMIGHLGSLNPE